MSLPLTGKVAIITGSSRSIGAVVARKLASDGANVVINFVSNSSPAQALVTEINAAGAGRAISVKANASMISEFPKLLDAAIDEWGRLDVLVLNTALAELQTSALDIDEKFFDDHFNANVKAPLFAVKAAVPLLRPGKMFGTLCMNYNTQLKRCLQAVVSYSFPHPWPPTQTLRLIFSSTLPPRAQSSNSLARWRSNLARAESP